MFLALAMTNTFFLYSMWCIEYRLGCVGHLGLYTLYYGLRKAVSTTDFVETLLINCNKYGHMFGLTLSSLRATATSAYRGNCITIPISQLLPSMKVCMVMQLPVCMLLWPEDTLMSNLNM
jgi:hypothetical protein